MSLDVRIEINWNITLWNGMKLNKYQSTREWGMKKDGGGSKSNQTHEKLYNNNKNTRAIADGLR